MLNHHKEKAKINKAIKQKLQLQAETTLQSLTTHQKHINKDIDS